MKADLPETGKHRLNRWQLASLVLAVLGVSSLLLALWMMATLSDLLEVGLEWSGQEMEEEAWQAEQVRQFYPVGKLVVTSEREDYESDEMRLVIPVLGQDLPVADETEQDPSGSGSGPGLLQYAQLPAPDVNANVSIAVDSAGQQKSSGIGQLSGGDLLYLVYQDHVYVYLYESTRLAALDDWEPMACKGYPCLTLTCGNLPGSLEEQTVVTARLVDVRQDDGQERFDAQMDLSAASSQG